jgi:hypothetical protein
MQKILIIQQNGAGERKASGIKRFGKDKFIVKTFDVQTDLPEIIDNGFEYLPDKIDADLVLDFLKHPDLSEDLVVLCDKQKIPVISTGKKNTREGAICPPT